LLSCILIDVDYFKNYNDLYGHQSGDKCLKDIAMVMKDTFRRAGDVVARYGGEEFIIIMSETDKEGTIAVITQFWRELEKLKILQVMNQSKTLSVRRIRLYIKLKRLAEISG